MDGYDDDPSLARIFFMGISHAHTCSSRVPISRVICGRAIDTKVYAKTLKVNPWSTTKASHFN